MARGSIRGSARSSIAARQLLISCIATGSLSGHSRRPCRCRGQDLRSGTAGFSRGLKACKCSRILGATPFGAGR